MEFFSDSLDLVRIVFLIGAVLSLIYKKRTGITPGGIIVPGTLAVVLDVSFTAFVFTIVLAALCRVIYKYTFGAFPLSNRWAVITNISLSLAIGLIITQLTGISQVLDQGTLMLSFVVPGLIAQSSKKYGIGKVMYGMSMVTAVTYAAGMLLALLIPHSILTHLSVQLGAFTPLTITHPFVVLTVSLLSAVLIYWRFRLRGGGYLIAPFIAVVAVSAPLQALALAVGVLLSYTIVQLIQRNTLVIGLERFVISLFCGFFVVTVSDIMATYGWLGTHYRPSALVMIIAVAVMINDLCLQPIKESLSKGLTPAIIISYLTRLAV